MNSLSIIYITNRSQCLFHWFTEGLAQQRKNYPGLNIQIVLVDYLHQHRIGNFDHLVKPIGELTHVAPLPSVTQGPHKLTKKDYYSGTLATNTGVVYCKHDYMVCVADLCVLGDDWLENVVMYMNRGEAFCGSYRKDKNMIVENGKIISSDPEGNDTRLPQITQPKTLCAGGWLYGASFGMPLETMLQLNGCDEICTMVGTEDTQLGQRLTRTGIPFWFDTDILTIESVEHHFLPGAYFTRESCPCSKEDYFKRLRYFGITATPERPDDKYDIPWFINDLLRYKPWVVESFINTYNLRELRTKIQSGQQITLEDMNYFPFFWFTGKPLNEM